MKVVGISIGGSVVSQQKGRNTAYMKALALALKRHKNRYKFVLAVGGGYASRRAIESAKKKVKSDYELDKIGIAVTRKNAAVLRSFISGAYPKVIANLDELQSALRKYSVAVIGGLFPGITTDGVCVLACEAVGAKLLVNVSRDAYVYDRPPAKRGAKRLRRLTHAGLVALAAKYDTREAKSDFVFDIFASKLAERSNIKICFVNDDAGELEKALSGKRYEGTVVEN